MTVYMLLLPFPSIYIFEVLVNPPKPGLLHSFLQADSEPATIPLAANYAHGDISRIPLESLVLLLRRNIYLLIH